MELAGVLRRNHGKKKTVSVYRYLRRYRWRPLLFQVYKKHDRYEFVTHLQDGYIIANVTDLDGLWKYLHKPTFYGLQLQWLGYYTVISPLGKKNGRPLEKESHVEIR
jgi:hypothetical protein